MSFGTYPVCRRLLEKRLPRGVRPAVIGARYVDVSVWQGWFFVSSSEPPACHFATTSRTAQQRPEAQDGPARYHAASYQTGKTSDHTRSASSTRATRMPEAGSAVTGRMLRPASTRNDECHTRTPSRENSRRSASAGCRTRISNRSASRLWPRRRTPSEGGAYRPRPGVAPAEAMVNGPDMAAAAELIHSGELVQRVEKAVGQLK